jgi:tRNA U55 pseudouridine synthase TruB
MFEWARAGKIKEAGKIKRTTKIYKINLIGKWQKIDADDLLKVINKKIDLVKGDFRQEKIKTAWQKVLEKSAGKYPVIKIKVSCSSGTYIRSLASELGKKLKTGAVLSSLKRTKVGGFMAKDATRRFLSQTN